MVAFCELLGSRDDNRCGERLVFRSEGSLIIGLSIFGFFRRIKTPFQHILRIEPTDPKWRELEQRLQNGNTISIIGISKSMNRIDGHK